MLAVFLVVGFTVFGDKDFLIVSPIADVGLTRGAGAPVNNWFPKKVDVSLPYPLLLGAKGAILVDYDNSSIIYSKDENEKLPAASTIKIMTALIALENASLDDQLIVSDRAASVGENSMGLTAGEKLSLEELLYGLMLVSGNDAAIAIAEEVAGSEEKFVQMMNRKAGDLKLSDSKFINATGLDVDGQVQFSSAYDLAVIAHYLWENYPQIRKITATYRQLIEANENHKAFDLYNDTNLLTTYPGVRGIKPGFTWEAGLCLVTYVENEGKRFIGVILGSDDRRGEMKELLDWGFAQYGIFVEHPGLDL